MASRQLGARSHRRIGAATAALLTVALVSVIQSGSARADDPLVIPPDYAAASAQAQQSGQPVEVTDQTSQTSQVIANPDGSFTQSTDPEPVRAVVNGSWTPIDTTLHRTTNGSVTPAVTDQQMTFSGGGTAPMVSLTQPAGSLALSWPNALPTPTLNGPTATYANVFPGVDLTLTAYASGYSAVMVVNDANAAANPALTDVQLTATGTGVALQVNDDGTSAAVDSSGNTVFEGPPPTSWDSTVDTSIGGTPSIMDAGSGHLTPVQTVMSPPHNTISPQTATTVTTSTLELTVPQDALTGPGVEYPVFIDPTMAGGGQQGYATVTTLNNWHYYNDPHWNAQVGACPNNNDPADCGGNWKARSFFTFDDAKAASPAATPHIFDAYLYLNEVHSENCSDQPTRLFGATGGINGNTAWGGPVGSELETRSSHFGDPCGSARGNLIFHSTNLINYVQGQVNASHNSITFGVLADDENNQAQWKRFAGLNSGNKLVITYDFKPNTPTGLHVSNQFTCGGVNYTSDTQPTVYATGTNASGSPAQTLHMYFQINDNNNATKRFATPAPGVALTSGHVAGWKVSSDLNGQTSPHQWWLYAREDNNDGHTDNLYSNWTEPPFPFTTDSVPTQAPTIATFDYPSASWGAPGGALTVDDNGAADIAGFTYSWRGSGDEAAPSGCPTTTGATTTRGFITGTTASLPAPTNLGVGPHTLWIKSYTKAHHLSPESHFSFYLAPNLGITPITSRLEGENSAQVTATGRHGTSTLAAVPYPGGTSTDAKFSGGKELFFGGWAKNDQLRLQFTLPTPAIPNPPDSMYYDLGIKLGTEASSGKLSFAIDPTSEKPNGTYLVNPYRTTADCGLPVGTITTDTYASTAGTTYINLGGQHLSGGDTHTLVITACDTNAASTGDRYHIDVDYLTAVPLENGSYASVNAALNNHALAIDGAASTTARFDMAGNTNLSAAAFSAVGLTTNPNAPAPIAGVPFHLFSPNGENDNLVAAGQTVNLTAGTDIPSATPGEVDLLATSVYGNVPTDAHITLNVIDSAGNPVSIDYRLTDMTDNDGTPRNRTVCDWAGATCEHAAEVTLSHYDSGTTPNATHTPHLWVVKLPNYLINGQPPTVKSITLPNIGSAFTTGSTAMHIFALTTS